MKRADLIAGETFYHQPTYGTGEAVVVLATEALLPGKYSNPFRGTPEPIYNTVERDFTLPDGTTKTIGVREPGSRDDRTKVLVFRPQVRAEYAIEFVNLRTLLGPYEQVLAAKAAEQDAAARARRAREAAAQEAADARNAAQADLVALLGAPMLPAWARTPDATVSLSTYRTTDISGGEGTISTTDLLRLVTAAYEAGRRNPV